MRLSPLLPSAPPTEAGDAASDPGPGGGFGTLMAELDGPPARGAAAPAAGNDAPLRRWAAAPDAAALPEADAAAALPFGDRERMASGGRDAGDRIDAPAGEDPAQHTPLPAPLSAADAAPAARTGDLPERPAPARVDDPRVAPTLGDDPRAAGGEAARPGAPGGTGLAWPISAARRLQTDALSEPPLRQPASSAGDAAPAGAPGGMPAAAWAMLMQAGPAADRGAGGAPASADPGMAAGDGATGAAAEPRITVSILHRETHFAPVRSFTQALAAEPPPPGGAQAQDARQEGAVQTDRARNGLAQGSGEPVRSRGDAGGQDFGAEVFRAGSSRVPDGRVLDAQDARVQDPLIQDRRVQDPRFQDPGIHDPRVQEPRVQEPRARDTRARDVRAQENRTQENRTQESRTSESRTQESRTQDIAAAAGSAIAGAGVPEIAPSPSSGSALAEAVNLAVPAGPAPLAMRVGAAVAGEAARLLPAALAQDSPTPGGPVRVLELALSPETLGRVVVRLRLTADGLTVRMRADNPETARMLEEDRPRLLQALAAAGAGPVEMESADPFMPQPLAAAAPDTRTREGADRDAAGDERRQPPHQEHQDETPSHARRGRGDAAAG